MIEQLASSTTIIVLIGTGLLGIACGMVGTFTVLRQRALVGDALAHASLPGICIAYLLFRERSLLPLLSGAICFGLISVWLISFIRSNSRIKEDAAIGIVLSSLFGLGLALSRHIQNLPDGNRAGLDDFIFGRAATMTYGDIWLIGGVAIVCIVVVSLAIKEMKLLCFDRTFCAALGFSVYSLDLLLMVLVCLCTAVGLPSVGAVLISALLIFPAVTARLWTDSLESMVALAAGFGFVACLIGTSLSAILPAPSGAQSLGFPTGPLIILSCASLFIASSILSPRHGLLGYYLKRCS